MITVVGSCDVDYICLTERLPEQGELLFGGKFFKSPGGKGANQSIAAARCGAQTAIVAKVGSDAMGTYLIECLETSGVDTSFILSDEGAKTGVELVLIDDRDSRTGVVAAGANARFTRADVLRAEPLFEDTSVLIVQLETSAEAVFQAVAFAKKYDCKVILNPVPFSSYAVQLFMYVDYVVLNDKEASVITGIDPTDDISALAAAEVIADLGAKTIIITMGRKGCFVYQGPMDYKSYPAMFTPNLVDTMGAGDGFIGGFAKALEDKKPMPEAIRYASAVASLCVTKPGASTSMPLGEKVEQFLLEYDETQAEIYEEVAIALSENVEPIAIEGLGDFSTIDIDMFEDVDSFIDSVDVDSIEKNFAVEDTH